MEQTGNYWDWVSAQEQRTDEDSEDFTEVLTEAYDTLKPALDSMVWPECNILYLNQIYRVPQRKIGEYIGLSQYGVSKRLRAAIRRLKMKLKCPEQNLTKVRQELSLFLSPANLHSAMSYYYFNSFQISVFLNTRIHLTQLTHILEQFNTDYADGLKQGLQLTYKTNIELSKNLQYQTQLNNKTEVLKIVNKYLPYFQAIKEITTVGESAFKNQERVRELSNLTSIRDETDYTESE